MTRSTPNRKQPMTIPPSRPQGRPHAVLLDVGGVFMLPDPAAITSALKLADVEVNDDALDEAHYRGVCAFAIDYDVSDGYDWSQYLQAYCRALAVPPELEADAMQHLGAAFASMASWSREVPGAKAGLRRLVDTGVPVGVISNADGTVAAILREHDVLQVGPGPGVAVRCLIDSGEVGVEKPDPRIFRIALDALDVEADKSWYVGDTPAIDVVGARRAGLWPILMDPFHLHDHEEYDRVSSLHDVARLVDCESET